MVINLSLIKTHLSWSQTHYMAKDKPFISDLPAPTSSVLDYRYVCGAGDKTQSFMHATQALIPTKLHLKYYTYCLLRASYTGMSQTQ